MKIFFLLLLVTLVACGGSSAPSGDTAPTADVGAIQTQAAAAVLATLTAGAPAIAPTDLPAPVATTEPTTEPPAAPAAEPTAVPASPAAAVGKIGERVEGGGIALMVNKVESGPLSQFYKPKGVVFIVDATIENVSLDEVDVNPLNFYVRDETGLQVGAALGAPERQISLGALAPGEKIRGSIGFDVPADAKGFIFFYDAVFSSIKGLPRIALDR